MNKVKPFYIRITDEISPQTAREIKDKCIKQGVAGDFHFNPADVKRWKYLGVCSQDGVCYSDFTENFYGEAKEITLDRLDEWLGIESQKEKADWDGKGLPPVGVECELKYKYSFNAQWRKCKIFAYSNEHGVVAGMWYLDGEIWHHNSIDVNAYEFRMLETPQQKAEREMVEAIKEIQRDMEFSGSDYLAAERLYDKGYRKQ